MRISIFPAVLSLIVAAVLAWLAYDIAYDEKTDLDVYVAIGTGLSVLLTMGFAMACKPDNTRVSVNFKVWSALMFVVMVISNFCFAGFGVKMPWYVVVTACLLVLHVGVAWSLFKMKNI
jgi:3-oxoacyl-(acyl-carrier-protein) synthase